MDFKCCIDHVSFSSLLLCVTVYHKYYIDKLEVAKKQENFTKKFQKALAKRMSKVARGNSSSKDKNHRHGRRREQKYKEQDFELSDGLDGVSIKDRSGMHKLRDERLRAYHEEIEFCCVARFLFLTF